MEEAEALSDKVMILHEGDVKCVGTPLELKKTYGQGNFFWKLTKFRL